MDVNKIREAQEKSQRQADLIKQQTDVKEFLSSLINRFKPDGVLEALQTLELDPEALKQVVHAQVPEFKFVLQEDDNKELDQLEMAEGSSRKLIHGFCQYDIDPQNKELIRKYFVQGIQLIWIQNRAYVNDYGDKIPAVEIPLTQKITFPNQSIPLTDEEIQLFTSLQAKGELKYSSWSEHSELTKKVKEALSVLFSREGLLKPIFSQVDIIDTKRSYYGLFQDTIWLYTADSEVGQRILLRNKLLDKLGSINIEKLFQSKILKAVSEIEFGELFEKAFIDYYKEYPKRVTEEDNLCLGISLDVTGRTPYELGKHKTDTLYTYTYDKGILRFEINEIRIKIDVWSNESKYERGAVLFLDPMEVLSIELSDEDRYIVPWGGNIIEWFDLWECFPVEETFSQSDFVEELAKVMEPIIQNENIKIRKQSTYKNIAIFYIDDPIN